jgi:hypothetical protein
MAAVTGFRCVDDQGHPILADAHGNNVAFRCMGCGGPVLAVVLGHQRGSSPGNPSRCRACESEFWVAPDIQQKLITVHRVK